MNQIQSSIRKNANCSSSETVSKVDSPQAKRSRITAERNCLKTNTSSAQARLNVPHLEHVGASLSTESCLDPPDCHANAPTTLGSNASLTDSPHPGKKAAGSLAGPLVDATGRQFLSGTFEHTLMPHSESCISTVHQGANADTMDHSLQHPTQSRESVSHSMSVQRVWWKHHWRAPFNAAIH